MTLPLTTEDVRALRRATDLCFDHGSSVETSSQSRIRAISGGRGGPRPEQTYVVPVEGNRVRDYTPTPNRDGLAYDCFNMAMNCQHMPEIRTMVHLIQKGDRLGFSWTRGNSSPVTIEAGIVVDHLDVEVVKPSGKVLTFRVGTYIGRDNSARMVRPRRVI